MKTYKFTSILLIAVMMFAISCTTTVEQQVSTGKNAEILIYTSTSLWKSPLGDSLKFIFMQPQEGLNQSEPMFTLLHLDKLDDLFKKHRNILHLVVSDTVSESKLQYSDNVFAKPQTYVEAYAPNIEEMVLLLKKAEKVLFEKFRQTDYARIQRAYKMQESIDIQNQIKAKFNISMVIPKSFFVAKDLSDFMWLRLETNRYSQGLMIYRTPYRESLLQNPDDLIRWKNTITETHIPGEVDNSYMRTDTLTSPIVNYVKHNGNPVLEVRGLWLTMGDFMGGPYVTLFMSDPNKEYIYAFDSFVFYPSRDKRDLLLQLEAIMHSVKFL